MDYIGYKSKPDVILYTQPRKCNFCPKTFLYPSLMRVHMKIHTGENQYICTVCKKEFRKECYLRAHSLRCLHGNPSNQEPKPKIHCGEEEPSIDGPPNSGLKICKDEDEISCEELNSETESESDSTHTTMNYKENPFQCDLCTRECVSLGQLKIHMRVHTGQKPFICTICKKRFNQKGNMERHKQNHRSQTNSPGRGAAAGAETREKIVQRDKKLVQKKHTCPLCQSEFYCWDSLKTHYFVDHGQKLTISAYLMPMPLPSAPSGRKSIDFDNQTSKSERILQTDEDFDIKIPKNEESPANTPNNVPNFSICYYCQTGFMFNEPNAAKLHFKIHSWKNPYMCNHCQQSFSTEIALKSHQDDCAYNGGIYFCFHCKKRYMSRRDLETHMAVHSGEKLYICTLCSKEFYEESELSAHSLLCHASQNSSEMCEINKVFVEEHNTEVHTGETASISDIKEQCHPPVDLHRRRSARPPKHLNSYSYLLMDSDLSEDDDDTNTKNSQRRRPGRPRKKLNSYLTMDNDSGLTSPVSQNSSEMCATSNDFVEESNQDVHNGETLRTSDIKEQCHPAADLPRRKPGRPRKNVFVEKSNPDFYTGEAHIISNIKQQSSPPTDSHRRRPGRPRKNFHSSLTMGSDSCQTVSSVSQNSSEMCENFVELNLDAHTGQTANISDIKEQSHPPDDLHRRRSARPPKHLNSYSYLLMDSDSSEEDDDANSKNKLSPSKLELLASTNVRTGKKPFCCPVCKKRFSQLCNVKVHLRLHTGEKPFKCKQCDMAFVQRISLGYHVRRFHPGQTQAVMQKNYKRSGPEIQREQLRRLQIRDNSEDDLTDNPVVYPLESNCTTEQSPDPPVLKSWTCNHCKTGFIKSTTNEELHSKTHTGEKPWVCNHCEESFVSTDDLRSHQLLSHRGNLHYVCDECKRRFISILHLESHLHAHTGEKPFHCSICSKSFNSKYSLRNHESSHTRKKSYGYECQMCNQRFTSWPCLKTHSQTECQFDIPGVQKISGNVVSAASALKLDKISDGLKYEQSTNRNTANCANDTLEISIKLEPRSPSKPIQNFAIDKTNQQPILLDIDEKLCEPDPGKNSVVFKPCSINGVENEQRGMGMGGQLDEPIVPSINTSKTTSELTDIGAERNPNNIITKERTLQWASFLNVFNSKIANK